MAIVGTISGTASVAVAGEEPGIPTSMGTPWSEFVKETVSEHLDARPTMGVQLGIHRYDGQLPDWSEEALSLEVAGLKSRITAVEAFPEGELDSVKRFDRDFLLAKLEEDLFWRTTADVYHTNPLFYAAALLPNSYLSRDYAPPEQRLQAVVLWMENLPRGLEQMRANLAAPMPRPFVLTSQALFGGLIPFIQRVVPATFSSVQDEALDKRLAKAMPAALAALGQTSAWLEGKSEEAGGRFALGRERYQQMLWATERIDTSVLELKRIALEDIRRISARLDRICSQYAPGADETECVRKARNVKPASDSLAAARQYAAELRQFVQNEAIVSIPEGGKLVIQETPPYLRFNRAFIELPGPFESEDTAFYNISPPNPEWPEEERQAYVYSEGELRFVTAHEVWPGHFLHYLHARRPRLDAARYFASYAFVEGWAHYVEEMLWEQGLDNAKPSREIGLLVNLLYRDARVLASVGLHTEDMSLEEAEELFRTVGFRDPGSARQQAARGTFDVRYYSYTIGRLMIRKLRRDWLELHGDRGLLEFHDELLKWGPASIPVLRRAMLEDRDDGALLPSTDDDA